MQAGELDLEVGPAVTVHVARDDGLVIGRARRILRRVVQLPFLVVKAVLADELEGLVARAFFGIDVGEVDQLGRSLGNGGVLI
jgi:hypothetical protein